MDVEPAPLANDDGFIDNTNAPRRHEGDLLSDSILISVHGSMMLIAWVGAGSVGIIIARYFRNTWTEIQYFQNPLWFTLHRACMLATWSFTMVAFAVILIDLDGWMEYTPHEILGLITIILTFVQPFFAVFRPQNDSPNYRYFRWGHSLGGTILFCLSITTFFLAVQLKTADLPMSMNWILTGFLFFHLFAHGVFSVLSYNQNDEHVKKRKIGLFVYIAIVLAFLTAMIILVVNRHII